MTASNAARKDEDPPEGAVEVDVNGTTIYVRLDPGQTMAGVCGISGLGSLSPEGSTP